ncbi:MAG TPA: GDSL-type esterase/lipase family protein [Bryobacteraceae bacterium]|nr:GDSL-type esterase/lipase family protein [Bryobacteraceae bacterium]
MRRLFALLLLGPRLSFAVDLERDTVSPAFEWQKFPYTWKEILAGDYKVTAVHWRKPGGNRLLENGMNSRPVRWDASTIRVFYGVRGPGKGIFYFDVDPENPGRIRSGPYGPIIATGPKGSYDDDWLIAPEPVRVSDAHLRMYYSAKTAGRPFFEQAWSLAFADSFDGGKTWRKHAGNPVLTTGTAAWERGAVGFCSVEKEADGWRMWYLGTNEKAVKQIGYATSSDGIQWKRHEGNPVLPVVAENYWESMALAVPRVIRDGRLLKVWYASFGPGNLNGGQGPYAVGLAESVDGIRWYRSPHNPVMKHSTSGWDSMMTAYPGVIAHQNRYYMWYSGNGYNAIGFAEARAPEGHRYYRTGPGAIPDTSWTAWKTVSAAEPSRSGFIQFAVRQTVPPGKIYFAGDSLTAGAGGFPEVISAVLGASYRGGQYRVVRNAKSGAKMNAIAQWTTADLSAKDQDANVVFVQDAGLTDHPIGAFEKSLRGVIAAAGSRNVLLINQARRPAGTPFDKRVVEGIPVEQWHVYWQKEVNPLIQQVARETGATLIDYETELDRFLSQNPNAPLLLADGVHLEKAGKLFLALLALRALGFSQDSLDFSPLAPLANVDRQMIDFVFAHSRP